MSRAMYQTMSFPVTLNNFWRSFLHRFPIYCLQSYYNDEKSCM